MSYTSRLPGEAIDSALLLAQSIGRNVGIPVGNGDGTIVIEAVDNDLSKNSRGIPHSQAVFQAIIKNQTVAKVYTLRGSVSDYDALPASAEIGDVYHVTDRNTCYAYSAVGWVDIGNAFATVNGQSPDENRNILISASNIYTSGDISVEEALSLLASMPHSGRNLLDNPFFTVNQRGATAYTVGAYGADRWKLVSGSATVTANGIVLNGTLRQILEQKPSGEVTASVKMYSGTGSAAYDSATGYFDITSSGGTVRAAKLEAGSVSTLENDEAPDYARELSKCQRYYNRIVSSYANQIVCVLTITPGKTVGWGLIPLSQKMRTSPALNAAGSFKCFSGASWTSYQPGEITIRGAAPDTEYFFIQVSLPAELTGGVGAFLQFEDNQSYLEFIADL